MEDEKEDKDKLESESAAKYKKEVLDDQGAEIPTKKNDEVITNYVAKNIKGIADALPEEFNVKHIGDLSYLLEIFSRKYDKYNSLDYLTKMRQGMIDSGYPDGSTLNEFLFWSTMSRKMQIIYQRMHAKLNMKKGVAEDDTENLTFLTLLLQFRASLHLLLTLGTHILYVVQQ